MKKVIKLTERDLAKLIRQVIKESEDVDCDYFKKEAKSIFGGLDMTTKKHVCQSSNKHVLEDLFRNFYGKEGEKNIETCVTPVINEFCEAIN